VKKMSNQHCFDRTGYLLLVHSGQNRGTFVQGVGADRRYLLTVILFVYRVLLRLSVFSQDAHQEM